MKSCRFSLFVLLTAGAALARGGPPLTDAKTPSPAAEVARAWIVASFQAPHLDYYGSRPPESQALRMLAAVQRGEQLRSGMAWYDPGERRHDWKWLAEKYDSNRDGRITKAEFAGDADMFTRLDRDRDGAITAEDFDWSERSPWVKQEAQALRLFRAIDSDGNGKISEMEMRSYHKKLAGEKGFLSPEDLRTVLFPPEKPAKSGPKKVSERVWMESLLAGDLGSPLDGPKLGELAPDFTLATQDGKKEITLSKCWGQQPVVLIFGSFT